MSSLDSDKVESFVRSLLSDEDSVTLETDEDEDPPEIILDNSYEEPLAEWYMPPNKAGSAASVAVIMGWVGTCLENHFLTEGPIYSSFPNEYGLALAAEGDRITNCPLGHVAIYAHMLDFGLPFPLDPFIVEIFRAWNICWIN